MRPCLVLLAFLTATSPRAAARPRVAVLDLTALGAEPALARSLTDAVVAEVARRGFFEPLSAEELRVLLGAERQRQLLGCSEGSCLTELAGALGAPFLLAGSISKVGDAFQLSLQLSNAERALVVGRAVRLARDPLTLFEQLPLAVAEATGVPPPTPPSRVLPITFVSVGGASLLAGGLVGLITLNQEAGLATELRLVDAGTAAPRPAEVYEVTARQLSVQRTLSLGLLIGGAVLTVLGVTLFALPTGESWSTQLAVTMNGVTLTGGFP